MTDAASTSRTNGSVRAVAKMAKRIAILIVGTAVLLAGVAMLALPGPGVLVIIVGLAILATEFAWAERLLDRTVERAADVATGILDDKRGRIGLAISGVSMIIAGIGVVIFFPEWIAAGISISIGGAIGLVTLHPKVGLWVEERARLGINTTEDVPTQHSLHHDDQAAAHDTAEQADPA